MQKVKQNVFFLFPFLIVIGFLFRLCDVYGGALLMIIGFLGVIIFYTRSSIRNIKKEVSRIVIITQVMVVLMSVSLFTRYLYFSFGDYPSLIIVPLFILISLIYLIREKNKSKRMSIVLVLYLVMTIPLFGFVFYNSPIQFIPKSWYDRYGDTKGEFIDLPYTFKNKKAEQLSKTAKEQTEDKHYYKAIALYQQARTIEPHNPELLFDLSETYALINQLQTAIELLDTAIMLDDKCAAFYNNRGLLYYKLKDNEEAISNYQKALEIDSTYWIYYSNLALVYYQNGWCDMACTQLNKAKNLGLNINSYKELKRIEEKCCK